MSEGTLSSQQLLQAGKLGEALAAAESGQRVVPTGVTVKLLKPGKGPLKPLRYAFVAGQKHAIGLYSGTNQV